MMRLFLGLFDDRMAPRPTRRRRRATPSVGFRPYHETLEVRITPATVSWTGAVSTLWSDTGNWDTGTAPVAGDDLVFPSGTPRQSLTNDLTAGLSFNSIEIGDAYSIDGAAITLAGTLNVTTASGVANLNLPTNFTTGVINSTNALGGISIGGVISGSAGITKSGPGILDIAGDTSNTYTGTMTIVSGPAGIFKSGLPGVTVTAITGDLVIGDGASVTTYYHDQIADASNVTIGLGGTLALENVSEKLNSLSMTGGIVTTGAGMISVNHRIDVLASAQSSTISGTLAMLNINPKIGVADGAAADDLVISASLLNPNGPLIKIGAGTALISSSNPTMGNTDVGEGTLAISNGAALGGSTTVTMSKGATLDLRGAISFAPAITTIAFPLGLVDAARILASGNATMNGNVALGATLNYEVASGLNLLVNPQTITETVAGSAVTKTGTGQLSYQANSSYTGGTTIAAGTLQARSSGALGSFGAVVVEAGATLDLYDNSPLAMGNINYGIPSGGLTIQGGGVGGTAGALSKMAGSGPITLTGGAVNLAENAAVRVDAGDLRFQQATTGSKMLTKQGAGVLGLLAANNGLLSAEVMEGSLFVLGSNTFNVLLTGGGSTLGGNGSVGSVLSNSGSLSAGILAAGALTTSDLTLGGSSTFDVDIDGNTPGDGAGMSGFYDQTTVNGTVTLGGSLNLNVTGNFSPSLGGILTLIVNDAADAVIGTFDGLPEGGMITAGTNHFAISYVGGDGNDVVLRCILSTTTTVTSSTNPSNNGTPITLTASVSAAFGTPGGTVTFYDGAAQISNPVTLVGGGASIGYDTTMGLHNITAVYSGGFLHFASTSAVLIQDVLGAATVTSLATPTATVFGQSANFTAFVTSTSAGTISGSVTFFSDGVSLGSGLISGGQASISTSSLDTGSHTMTATYNGDSVFASGTTAVGLSQAVNKANTSLVAVSSANPAAPGILVTFTATLSVTAPGAGSPTGLVWFFDGPDSLGAVEVVNGVASLATSLLSLGSHSITAYYSGDNSFSSSPIATITQEISNTAATTTTLAATTATVFGQSATFTASVSSATVGAITGSVTFFADGVPIGSGTVVSGQASLSLASLATGIRSITATYNGDVNYSSGTTASPALQVVNKASSSVTVGTSVNPSSFGQGVTLQAIVAAAAPGAGPATGTVTFYADGVILGTGMIFSGGTASLGVSGLAVGSHSITATYGGDGNFNMSTNGNILSQVVERAATGTTLCSDLAPSVYGQTVTFTAKVSAAAPGAGEATGTVTFFADGVSIGTGTLSGGVTTLPISTLTGGTHVITATYDGDPSFTASTSTGFNQTVTQAATGAILTLQGPTVSGQFATYVVTVGSVGGAPMPTGNATITLGNGVLGTSPLNASGLAYFVLAIADVGNNVLTGHYLGDADHASITTADQTQAVGFASAGVLISAPPTSSIGQLATFTATVQPLAPGAGTITGSVLFYDGSVPIGTGIVANGVASFSTILSPGLHAIAAAYLGDAHFNYAAAPSPAIVNTVPAASAVTLVMPGTSINGQAITFTAFVNAGASAAAGTLTFYADGVPTAPITLAGGMATFTTNGLPAGTHAISATYNGSATVAGSASAASGQVVGQAGALVGISQSTTSAGFAQAVTFLVNVGVAAPGAGLPTGTVTIAVDGTAVTAVNLVNGVGTFTASALPVGFHAITATYNGSSSFIALNSASASLTVTKAATASAVSSTPYARGLILTARVTPAVASGAFPTGSVTIRLNGVVQGTAQLINGSYSWTLATAAVRRGMRYTMHYSGDANFTASTSPAYVL
jgi:autotransporter-associated beta strand protein